MSYCFPRPFSPSLQWLLFALLVLVLPAQPVVADDESSATRVITINLEQAKRLYDLGAVFIDVRSDEQWQLGHIKDARHVSFTRNFARLKNLEGIDRETPLVFYCGMPECKVGPYASAVSMEWGFENVFYFRQGYFAWLMQDYPVEINKSSD